MFNTCQTNHLFVIHDAERSGHHDVSELTRRKQVVRPLLDGSKCQIESWRNNTALIKTADELNDNLAAAMVIDDLEFANISWLQQLQLDVNNNIHISFKSRTICSEGDLLRSGTEGHIPCLCITCRYFTITFEHGRIKTWRFPAFSALLSDFKASANTLIRTIARVSAKKKISQFPSHDYLPAESWPRRPAGCVMGLRAGRRGPGRETTFTMEPTHETHAPGSTNSHYESSLSVRPAPRGPEAHDGV